jgi:phosphoglucomutase
METAVKQKYEDWLKSPYIDAEDRKELKGIKYDEKEIAERFYTDLEFGTGGLRGVRGIGTNRINKYVIRKATQGLANYILKNGDPKKGVAIAYDCRIGSTEYSLNAALVLAANGIKAYLFESLRSTPELSFAVRELGTQAGIVVTASHNPVEYNGYKVYWEDGAQVVPPHDTGIIGEVNAITDFSQIKIMEEAEAKEKGLLEIIGGEIDDKYIEEVKKQQLNTDVKKDIKIVYTPLHGTGKRPVQRILSEIGFTNVYTVSEQEMPDGTFPTVNYANPEEPAAFALGVKLAEEKGAELVMANDPDADRIGIAVKSKTGAWIYPNGNQVGLLLMNYILENRKDIPSNGAVISTIVSTPMLDAVAKAHNVNIMRTLTGFKYIGEKIREFEQGDIDGSYIFGFEESYGYLIGTHARDKDAVVSTMLIAEMAAYYNEKGSSIEEEIEKMYKKYGYYKEGIKSVTMSGMEGAEKIKSIMADLRENAPETMMGKKVVFVRDYQNQVETNKVTGETKAIDLPESNVLQLVLEDGTHITARPSGTEPKIKYYFGVNGNEKDEVDTKLEQTMQEFLKLLS